MTRVRLRPYLLVAVLVAVIPFAWGVLWGADAGATVVASVMFLALAAEVILAVLAILSSLRESARSTERRIEKARSQLDWRAQYETSSLFKSLKTLHQDNVAGWRQLGDHPHGARRQTDRAVKALMVQAEILRGQHEEIAHLRNLVVELVARIDTAPESAIEKLASADRWLEASVDGADEGQSGSQVRRDPKRGR
ncbi:hypothetical protein [Agrococcus sp. ARC_14]|uniref:hypothetical protein n=1 Tax=Agrococcus sp. ARC_14 TaxID=2919927 RepID=UPI001F065BA6|nr:hypothetical protein [Agrococcus sp. ARC_14]MCH1884301.1 hypothetical protein [Agrococcus sp. ARC_14]